MYIHRNQQQPEKQNCGHQHNQREASADHPWTKNKRGPRCTASAIPVMEPWMKSADTNNWGLWINQGLGTGVPGRSVYWFKLTFTGLESQLGPELCAKDSGAQNQEDMAHGPCKERKRTQSGCRCHTCASHCPWSCPRSPSDPSATTNSDSKKLNWAHLKNLIDFKHSWIGQFHI